MRTVFVSIGGNIEPAKHIPQSLQHLQQHFGELQLSNRYESKAVGFEGDNFINLVVSFSTQASVAEVNQLLHQIEDAEGRERNNGKAWDSRTLDLDILLFGDLQGDVDGVLLPRPEILEHAHVLLPLCELAGQQLHVATGKTYQQLSQEADFSDQHIWLFEPT